MKFTVEVRKVEPYLEYKNDDAPRKEWVTLEIWPNLLSMGDGFASCIPFQDYRSQKYEWIMSTDAFTLVRVDVPIRRARDAAWLIAQNLSELTGTSWNDDIDAVIDQLWSEFPRLIATSEPHTHGQHLHQLIEWVCRSHQPVIHEEELVAAIDFVHPGRCDRKALHRAITDPRTEAEAPEHRERHRSSGIYASFVHSSRHHTV